MNAHDPNDTSAARAAKKRRAAKAGPAIRFTRLTLVQKEPVGKSYRLDQSGALEKLPVAGEVYAATARIGTVRDMAGFLEVRAGLERGREVLVYGTPTIPLPDAGLRVVTKDTLGKLDADDPDRKTTITRTNEHFTFARDVPGVLMLDHDPQDGRKELDREGLSCVLCALAPGMADHQAGGLCRHHRRWAAP
jgi:hypothetical protein